jgi:excisionase family DNA binding protein
MTKYVAADQMASAGGSHAESAPELLDIKEVARLLGHCSTRHVHRLADSGRMPRPVKLGTLIRWRRTELIAWLNDGCKPCGRRVGHPNERG